MDSEAAFEVTEGVTGTLTCHGTEWGDLMFRAIRRLWQEGEAETEREYFSQFNSEQRPEVMNRGRIETGLAIARQAEIVLVDAFAQQRVTVSVTSAVAVGLVATLDKSLPGWATLLVGIPAALALLCGVSMLIPASWRMPREIRPGHLVHPTPDVAWAIYLDALRRNRRNQDLLKAGAQVVRLAAISTGVALFARMVAILIPVATPS